MAEQIKGFSIELDLDHLSVDRGLKGLKDNLKTVNSEMKKNMSAFEYSEKSTKKYETSLMGLNKKFEVQKKAVAAARTEYEKMVAEHGRGSKEAEKAAREYNNQSASLANLERYISRTTKEMEEFEKQQRIANSNWTKVGESLNTAGNKMIEVGGATQEVGKKLTRNVTVPLGIVGGVAIKTGSDFESGMSKVGAVSGASAEDMVKLEAKAREMGATTVFSAKEASDAFYYMSLAGWDASESMDGISGVMDLAAASGEDLASVADIVTDGLTAFGLKAKDSGRMADVLASASANANTDVRGLGQAFAYAAPVAGALGYSMEDTSKAIGLMSNAGIKSTKAGTALRTMMTNLAKPTKAMEGAMKQYGISLVDSEGNMKSFDEVMLDLRKSLGSLDKQQQAQAAATIFGKEAMSGALAIVNASEEDYNKLTSAIQNSDGSAKDMADTMQDNLQGSLKELRSMAEDLFITMYKNLNPALETGVEKVKGLTEQFANLTPETQKTITKIGALAFVSGPAINGIGKLTSGLGKTFVAVGDVSKAIGIASQGGGLAAALKMLGPGAVAGVAIAGIGGVAYGVHKLKKRSQEAKEVNLELADSFMEQAVELENSVNTFDKLSEKAKASNQELSELNDLNIKISKSSNSGEIELLQQQYNELAKKTGLSKEELEKLFKANDFIIGQSPEVEKSISNEGNAFVENTDKVNEYIQSLYNMSKIELEAERTKQLAREKKIREELLQAQEKEAQILQNMNDLTDAYNGKVESSSDRIDEINNRLLRNKDTQETQNALIAEREILQALERGDIEKANELYRENIGNIQEILGIQKETTRYKQEELDKIEAIDTDMANILLKQVGINEEGEKGLQTLDESIAKSQEEIAILNKKKENGEKLTTEERERYKALTESNKKQKEVKQELYEELGLYSDINSLADIKLSKLNKEKKKKVESLAKSIEIKNTDKDIISQIDTKNDKLKQERDELVKNLEKQGKTKSEINGQTKELDNKISKNAEVKRQILEELGIWDNLDQSIKNGINSEIDKGNEVDRTRNKLTSQGSSIDSNNRKTETGIVKERARTKEAGKNVNKNVNVKDNGSIRELNKKASSPVTKVVNFVGRGLSKLKFWADGTPPGGHPGGMAVVGDGGGSELVSLPDGRSFLSPNTDTMLNLPKGTHVTPHKTTEKIMKNLPKYARGTDNWEKSSQNSEFARLLAMNNNNDSSIVLPSSEGNRGAKQLLEATIQQNKILIELLKSQDETLYAIENSNSDIVLDSRKIGESVSPFVSRNIKKNLEEDNWAKGGSY